MANLRLVAYALVFALLVSLVSLSGPLAAQPEPNEANASPLETALRRAADGDVRLSRDPRSGRVRFVGTGKDNPIAIAASGADDAESVARRFLSSYGPLFGVADQASELAVLKGKDVAGERSFVRFQQLHRGVPVLGGELIVQTGKGSKVLSAGGEVAAEVDVDTLPQVPASLATERALAAIAKAHGVGVESLAASDPALWVYNPAILGNGADRNLLVWRIEVTARDLAPIRELVLVDALTGNIALHFNQVDTAKHIRTYTANSTANLPGSLLLDTDNPALTTTDADALNAHRFANDTYNYYSTTHGRDSIDGAGAAIVSTVDYCPSGSPCPYENAGWNGTQMLYGDGFASADDVVAHEITHGVTQYESNLFYYFQSGAINESFSDIWGELVDQGNGAGDDSAGVRWQVGEDLSGIGVIRNMANPPEFGQPDRMGSSLYYCEGGDNGGVHYNSGVGNKAAYLMVDGGTFNGKTVAPLGATKTAKIWYEAQTSLLASASDYLDLYNALQQSCTGLVGTNGITQADCSAVKNALDAVEMSAQPANCASPEAPVCAAGQSPTNLYYDDIENINPGNWQTAATVGSADWSYLSGYATSGDYSLFGRDQAVRSDSYAMMAPGRAVTLPAGTSYLHFRHYLGFEYLYDGGVVEYTTDGGATWKATDDPAKPLTAINGYNASIDSDFGNPLADGRRVFSGQTYGYVSSRFDLTPLAGQTVRFRFRVGTDDGVGYDGWLIDDVRIYTCGASGVTPTATATNTATATATGTATATATPTATGTTTATATATATVPAGTGGRVYVPLAVRNKPYVYFDDFANPASGWPSGESAASRYGYANGEYEIELRAAYGLTAVLAPLSTSSSYALEVDLRQFSGYTDGGIVFDIADWSHFYTVHVDNHAPVGHYAVYRYDAGNWVEVIGWTSSPQINVGGSNRLRLERNGSQIAVYVNDSLLATAYDATYAYDGIYRGVALFAEGVEVIPSAMRFDNFGALGSVARTLTVAADAFSPPSEAIDLPVPPVRP